MMPLRIYCRGAIHLRAHTFLLPRANLQVRWCKWGSRMRAKVRRRCPIFVDLGGDLISANLFASNEDQPADVAIKLRENGWNPYRVRFDSDQATWIVSSLDKFHRI